MNRTTKAAVLFEIARPLRVADLDLPELRPGQVLVDVAFSGVCHSQLNEIRGLRGPDRFLPHTLGHEGSAVVRAIADGVTKVQPGDHVVLSWIRGSGAEVASTVYGHSGGSVNSGAVSTFMRTAIASENRVTKIPDNMPLREAALLGCAIPTGAGAVLNTARLRPGQSVAVFGVGGIGMSAIMAGVLMRAHPLIAVDVQDEKLEQARRLGATHAVNAGQTDPVSTIRDLTSGKGVDCAVEAAGRRETMGAAFKAIREQGGLCVLAGNLAHGEQISIDPMDLIRGRRIVGTWGGDTVPDRDIPQYAERYLAGDLKLDQLISRSFPLDEINDALHALEHGDGTRVLIEF